MNTYKFAQLGETLPDVEADGHNEYAAVRALAERIGGNEVWTFGAHHWAISTHNGTGIAQFVLKETE